MVSHLGQDGRTYKVRGERRQATDLLRNCRGFRAVLRVVKHPKSGFRQPSHIRLIPLRRTIHTKIGAPMQDCATGDSNGRPRIWKAPVSPRRRVDFRADITAGFERRFPGRRIDSGRGAHPGLRPGQARGPLHRVAGRAADRRGFLDHRYQRQPVHRSRGRNHHRAVAGLHRWPWQHHRARHAAGGQAAIVDLRRHHRHQQEN